MTEHAITAEHRAKFAASLEYWQDELSLRDWRIRLQTRPARKTVMAEISIDLEARLAKVGLSTAWPMEPTDQELDDTALHELLHVFLKPLLEAAKGDNDLLTGSVEHSVINTLERLLSRK